MTVPGGSVHPRDVEVVILSSSGDLGWLAAWLPQLQATHVTIVCTNGNTSALTTSLPAALQPCTSVKSLQELQAAVGHDASQKLGPADLALLQCSKRYVLFLDEDCSPAATPNGTQDRALVQHATNLGTPSTPFFFNTLYDPFREGADFVRGYPFSLREGQPTAISHGSSLNFPDYDAATQMAKVKERNARYVDAVLTVPRGAFCNLSMRNLAVDRELAGVAMYSGLDPDGKPLGDATWASYCVKVVCDHLGLGVKTGIPYITCNKPAFTAATVNMEQEYKKVKWQKEVFDFFQNVKLSPHSNSSELAYLELAQKVRTELGAVDPHFAHVADAMEAWVALFNQRRI